MWQRDAELRAARRRLDFDLGVVVRDQPPDDVEAEAGALADRLGGEERVEDAGADSGGMPAPLSTMRHQHALPLARCAITSTRPALGMASSALSIRLAQI